MNKLWTMLVSKRKKIAGWAILLIILEIPIAAAVAFAFPYDGFLGHLAKIDAFIVLGVTIAICFFYAMSLILNDDTD